MTKWQTSYKYDPADQPRRRELEQLRSERELTTEERNELQWYVFSHTNFLLEIRR